MTRVDKAGSSGCLAALHHTALSTVILEEEDPENATKTKWKYSRPVKGCLDEVHPAQSSAR